MLAAFLHGIEETTFFSQIRDSAHGYPVLLWLHLLALVAWGGMILVTDLRLLGWGFRSNTVVDVVEGLRWPKRLSLLAAASCGILLFGAKAGQYADTPWFWIKMALLALLAATHLKLLRRLSSGSIQEHTGQLRLAGGLSLLFLTGAVWAARGPATIMDIMRSMVDPSADFLFQSMQTIADDSGAREVAPQTDEQWNDVRSRLLVLLKVPDLLNTPARRAARPRDRSQSPGVEDEPAEVQRLINANRPDFARRAQRLHDAASMAMRAVDGKDKDALWLALDGIDRACENCHLRYWYPKDKRAREAAEANGTLE